MSTTPELGFHYFDSPEGDDDYERIAPLFWSCSRSVTLWPAFRRDAIRRGRLTPDEREGVEKNVVAIFREVREVILAANRFRDTGPAQRSGFGGESFWRWTRAFLSLYADRGTVPEPAALVAELASVKKAQDEAAI